MFWKSLVVKRDSSHVLHSAQMVLEQLIVGVQSNSFIHARDRFCSLSPFLARRIGQELCPTHRIACISRVCPGQLYVLFGLAGLIIQILSACIPFNSRLNGILPGAFSPTPGSYDMGFMHNFLLTLKLGDVNSVYTLCVNSFPMNPCLPIYASPCMLSQEGLTKPPSLLYSRI